MGPDTAGRLESVLPEAGYEAIAAERAEALDYLAWGRTDLFVVEQHVTAAGVSEGRTVCAYLG
jgi:hypothetical protein